MVIATGWFWMFFQDQKAIHPRNSLQKWPAVTARQPVAGRWNLLVFLHPRCACAEPTKRAFEELMVRRSQSLTGRIIWAPDPDFGNFAVNASGEALLFDPQGELRFRGGITPSRSHTGRNPGVHTILAATMGSELQTKLSPIFGCSMNDEGQLR